MSTERPPVPDDVEIERLLADELAALTPAPLDELRRRRHVTAAAVAATVTATRSPLRTVGASTTRRRPPIAAVLVGSAAAVAVVLALASAHLLPDSVQARVADIAERVGLHLPGGGDGTGADRDDDRGDPPRAGVERARGSGGGSNPMAGATPTLPASSAPPASAAGGSATGRGLGGFPPSVDPPRLGELLEPPAAPEPEPPELPPPDIPSEDVPVVIPPDLVP